MWTFDRLELLSWWLLLSLASYQITSVTFNLMVFNQRHCWMQGPDQILLIWTHLAKFIVFDRFIRMWRWLIRELNISLPALCDEILKLLLWPLSRAPKPLDCGRWLNHDHGNFLELWLKFSGTLHPLRSINRNFSYGISSPVARKQTLFSPSPKSDVASSVWVSNKTWRKGGELVLAGHERRKLIDSAGLGRIGS